MIRSANKKVLPLALLLGCLTLGGCGWFGYSLWIKASQAQSGWRTADDDMRELLWEQSESRSAAKSQTSTAGSTVNVTETKSSTADPGSAQDNSKSNTSAAERVPEGKATAAPSSSSDAGLTSGGKGTKSEPEAPNIAAEAKGSTSAAEAKAENTTNKPSAKTEGVAKIRLNTATAQQLTAIPGIGESKAKAIVAYREQRGGRFQNIEQLLDVKGIGEKLLEKMKPYLTLES